MTDHSELAKQRIEELGEKYLLHPKNRVRRKDEFVPTATERDVVRELKKLVTQFNGEWRRVKWLERAHAPDVLVGFPYLGVSYWVETKRPGAEARAGQEREHNRMRDWGLDVRVIADYKGIKAFEQELLDQLAKAVTE